MRPALATVAALGADTVGVLASLGYDENRITALRSAGVLGPAP